MVVTRQPGWTLWGLRRHQVETQGKANFVVMPLVHLVGPAPASLGALAFWGGACAGISRSSPAAHSPACASHIHLSHCHQNGMELLSPPPLSPAASSNGVEIGCADKHRQHHHINTDGQSFRLIFSAKYAWAWGLVDIGCCWPITGQDGSRMGAIRKIAIGIFSS